MFSMVRARNLGPLSQRASGHISVARKREATYDPSADTPPADRESAPPSPAAEALARLDVALAELDAVDWSREDNPTVRLAAIALQRRVNQLSAHALRPIRQVDVRQAYQHDAAVTTASWLRNRVNMDPAAAARLCTTARRLPRLPLLAEAFDSGDITLSHVQVVTEAAVPTRFDAIASVEQPLVELARTDKPRALRAAVRAVRDIVDPDGSDPFAEPEPADADEHDARRYWHQRRTIDGMVEGSYLVDAVTGEMLDIVMDALSTADPAELPPTSRRSPAQKRADAMRLAVRRLLDAGLAPAIQGNMAHMLGMFDLLQIMTRAEAATFAAELRRHGRVSPATIARIGLDAKFTPVLTMGGYRVVAVGRTFRTVPPWLRPMLEMLHRVCRGPDCDRPAAWCEAAHVEDYAKGGNTDLNETVPLCKAHHNLVTYGGWTIDFDPDTGICTWTAPDGRTIPVSPR